MSLIVCSPSTKNFMEGEHFIVTSPPKKDILKYAGKYEALSVDAPFCLITEGWENIYPFFISMAAHPEQFVQNATSNHYKHADTLFMNLVLKQGKHIILAVG